MDPILVVELDDTERRVDLRDHDGGGGVARAMALEERAIVEVEQLVAVHRENRAVLAPVACCEVQPAAAAERLRFSHRRDLDAAPAER